MEIQLDLTSKEAQFLDFVINAFGTTKLKPEARHDATLMLATISLKIKVAKGELSVNDANELLWLMKHAELGN